MQFLKSLSLYQDLTASVNSIQNIQPRYLYWHIDTNAAPRDDGEWNINPGGRNRMTVADALYGVLSLWQTEPVH